MKHLFLFALIFFGTAFSPASANDQLWQQFLQMRIQALRSVVDEYSRRSPLDSDAQERFIQNWGVGIFEVLALAQFKEMGEFVRSATTIYVLEEGKMGLVPKSNNPWTNVRAYPEEVNQAWLNLLRMLGGSRHLDAHQVRQVPAHDQQLKTSLVELSNAIVTFVNTGEIVYLRSNPNLRESYRRAEKSPFEMMVEGNTIRHQISEGKDVVYQLRLLSEWAGSYLENFENLRMHGAPLGITYDGKATPTVLAQMVDFLSQIETKISSEAMTTYWQVRMEINFLVQHRITFERAIGEVTRGGSYANDPKLEKSLERFDNIPFVSQMARITKAQPSRGAESEVYPGRFFESLIPELLAISDLEGSENIEGRSKRVSPEARRKATNLLDTWALKGIITPDYIATQLDNYNSNSNRPVGWAYGRGTQNGELAVQLRVALAKRYFRLTEHLSEASDQKDFFDRISAQSAQSPRAMQEYLVETGGKTVFMMELVVKRQNTAVITDDFKVQISERIFDNSKNPRSLGKSATSEVINLAVASSSLNFTQLYALLTMVQAPELRTAIVAKIDQMAGALPSDRARQVAHGKALRNLMSNPGFCSQVFMKVFPGPTSGQ